MKKIFILSTILLTGCMVRAQRFFYIDNSPLTAKFLTSELQHAFQYVTSSPMTSDYIIKSEVGIQDENRRLTMQITLQDSISLETIFQSNETCDYNRSDKNVQLFLNMAVRTFLEKNISQIIGSAKDDHLNSTMKTLGARKDKS
jgi:hypothetical protein